MEARKKAEAKMKRKNANKKCSMTKGYQNG